MEHFRGKTDGFANPYTYAEICLCFDCDFSVESINEIIGISPTKMMRQSQTRVNPLTGAHNPGYWEYQLEQHAGFDCEPLLNTLECFLHSHCNDIVEVLQIHRPSDLIVRIYVHTQHIHDFPAISLHPSLISILETLDGSLEIIVEQDRFSRITWCEIQTYFDAATSVIKKTLKNLFANCNSTLRKIMQ